MRLVHFAFLACAGCSFPRPQELTNDAGERPGAADSGVDAGVDSGVDSGAIFELRIGAPGGGLDKSLRNGRINFI